MHGHAQGMFMGNVREYMVMHRECSWRMSGNAWSCTGNVEGESQGMHGHAQGMFMGNVREYMAMRRECSRGVSGNACQAQAIFNSNVRECMAMHRESKSTDNCSTRMLHSPDLQSSRFILSG